MKIDNRKQVTSSNPINMTISCKIHVSAQHSRALRKQGKPLQLYHIKRIKVGTGTNGSEWTEEKYGLTSCISIMLSHQSIKKQNKTESSFTCGGGVVAWTEGGAVVAAAWSFDGGRAAIIAAGGGGLGWLTERDQFVGLG